jgi:hypothetical protein
VISKIDRRIIKFTHAPVQPSVSHQAHPRHILTLMPPIVDKDLTPCSDHFQTYFRTPTAISENKQNQPAAIVNICRIRRKERKAPEKRAAYGQ